IAELRQKGYDPAALVAQDAELKRITDRISNGFSDGKSYSDLISNLLYGGDPYMLIADFRAYADCQDRLYKRISDASELGRLSIMNTAQSGFFAADRAIAQYAKEIWHID
ncbi:MAG: glycogen/starch/alpha-glucan phosphorylase, partial [Oscillospiraceae bacterium]|nr:glycogen/starch/alpha-glucan phosphorylase [Oscillospiraceae bacterium]